MRGSKNLRHGGWSDNVFFSVINVFHTEGHTDPPLYQNFEGNLNHFSFLMCVWTPCPPLDPPMTRVFYERVQPLWTSLLFGTQCLINKFSSCVKS